MNKKNSAKPKVDKSQVDAFRETAREIGADKPTDLDAVMKRLAGQKRREAVPPNSTQKRSRKDNE